MPAPIVSKRLLLEMMVLELRGRTSALAELGAAAAADGGGGGGGAAAAAHLLAGRVREALAALPQPVSGALEARLWRAHQASALAAGDGASSEQAALSITALLARHRAVLCCAGGGGDAGRAPAPCRVVAETEAAAGALLEEPAAAAAAALDARAITLAMLRLQQREEAPAGGAAQPAAGPRTGSCACCACTCGRPERAPASLLRTLLLLHGEGIAGFEAAERSS